MLRYLIKSWIIMVSGFACSHAVASLVDDINNKKWIHGSKTCQENTDPAIDVLRVNQASYILRQNKCTHYEAPFIYLLLGNTAAFLQDTGASEDAQAFPLYRTVATLVEQWKLQQNIDQLEIIVTHSHSHSDHRAADAQFKGKEGITLVEPNSESVRRYFGFRDWPNGSATIDLGGRILEVLPLPGHQEDALAVYDPLTKFVLSGDSFYPGRLYIKDWAVYKKSMSRLQEYAISKNVRGFLGTHIEMKSKPKKDYPLGATYQPNEANLVLDISALEKLNHALEKLGNRPKRKRLDRTIIYPVK